MRTSSGRSPKTSDDGAVEVLERALRGTFPGLRILVVGDLMLDRYIRGEVERISPEAPVPVLRPEEEESRPGGAGNVVLNLAGLGVEPRIAGFVGQDAAGERLLEHFAEAGVGTGGVIPLPGEPTTTKTRILAGHRHLLRVDGPTAERIGPDACGRLLERAASMLESGVDAVILSDYAKGTLPPETCRDLIAAARAASVPVFVDPKGADFSRYAGATALTPNLRELERATGLDAEDGMDRLIEGGRGFVEALGLEYMVLTLGPDGMTLIDAEGTLHRPAMAREVFDVSGAGDTVVAALAAGHVAGLGPEERLTLANVAAGIVVGKVGTAAVTPEAVLRELGPVGRALADSVCDVAELRPLVETWRSGGERIVFTNGCFDILHAGHVTYLREAAAAGDRLVVGINTDRSVRELKGEGRPINAQEDRACVVAALGAVDAVVLFDGATPLELIRLLRPDVLVKGGDYRKEEVAGARDVESWGGRVVLVPVLEGRSTSDLIRTISG